MHRLDPLHFFKMMYSDSGSNETRKMICSIVGGFVFGVGMWFIVDAGANLTHTDDHIRVCFKSIYFSFMLIY